MREPQDIFVKEFFQHPAWSVVIDFIERLAEDYKTAAAISSRDEHDFKHGTFIGVVETLAHIRGLIKSNK